MNALFYDTFRMDLFNKLNKYLKVEFNLAVNKVKLTAKSCP